MLKPSGLMVFVSYRPRAGARGDLKSGSFRAKNMVELMTKVHDYILQVSANGHREYQCDSEME